MKFFLPVFSVTLLCLSCKADFITIGGAGTGITTNAVTYNPTNSILVSDGTELNTTVFTADSSGTIWSNQVVGFSYQGYYIKKFAANDFILFDQYGDFTDESTGLFDGWSTIMVTTNNANMSLVTKPAATIINGDGGQFIGLTRGKIQFMTSAGFGMHADSGSAYLFGSDSIITVANGFASVRSSDIARLQSVNGNQIIAASDGVSLNAGGGAGFIYVDNNGFFVINSTSTGAAISVPDVDGHLTLAAGDGSGGFSGASITLTGQGDGAVNIRTATGKTVSIQTAEGDIFYAHTVAGNLVWTTTP